MPRQVGIQRKFLEVHACQRLLTLAIESQFFELLPQGRPLDPLGLEEVLHEVTVTEDELGEGPLLPGQLLRVFERAFQDEPGNRVDVDGRGLAAQPHGLQRDGPTARERIEHLGRTAAISLTDFIAKPLKVFDILRLALPVQDAALGLLLDPLDRLPIGHLFLLDLLHDLAADLLAELLPLFGRAWVRQQRGDQRRPAGRQRPPGRPDVQRRDMPMSHVLLMHAVQRRLLERKGNFDEAGSIGHNLFLVLTW